MKHRMVGNHPLYTDGNPSRRTVSEGSVRATVTTASTGLAGSMIEICEAPEANREVLLMAHEPGYVDRFLAGTLSDKEVRRIGLRPWTPQLRPRTLRIVGGAIAALHSAVATGGVAGNMAGGTHHAHRDFGSGYCVFNDLAVCAEYAQQRLGIGRVLVLDLDVHQGDGTATILADNPEAMTISVHCGANFPFSKAQSDLDLAVPPDAGDEACLPVVAEAIQRGMAFKPELVLYQAGVDGLATDALGRLVVDARGLQQRNRMVMEACREQSSLRCSWAAGTPSPSSPPSMPSKICSCKQPGTMPAWSIVPIAPLPEGDAGESCLGVPRSASGRRDGATALSAMRARHGDAEALV